AGLIALASALVLGACARSKPVALPSPSPTSYGSCDLDPAGCGPSPSTGGPATVVGGSAPAASQPSSSAATGTWGQYGYDAGLTGFDAAERVLGSGNLDQLRQSWAGQLDVNGDGLISVRGGFVYVGGTGLQVFPDSSGCAKSSGGMCQPGWTGVIPIDPSTGGA